MKPPPPRLPIVLMEPKDVKPAIEENPITAIDTTTLWLEKKLCFLEVFIYPDVSYQDQRVKSQHQMEETQNLQKMCHQFCYDLPVRGGAGCCQRMGHHQMGQHLITGG